MSRPEVTGRKTAPEPVVLGAYSIASFCRAHGGMSEAMFHKMAAAGDGPVTMMVGRRRMVTVESAARWRKQREAAAKATAKSKIKEIA